jgi:hypothetical protein
MWAISKYKSGAIDNPQFVEAMVKGAFGTTLMTLAAETALNGHITGGGPPDPKERAELQKTGWQPYSLRYTNPATGQVNYLNYQRIEPFSTLLGTAADMAEAWKAKDIQTPSELLTKGVTSVANNFENKSFIAGLDNFMKLLTDPGRAGVNAIKQLQASMIPNVVGVVPFGQLARATDPTYRETQAGNLTPFIASIPGLSQTLEPQYDPGGEPRQRKGTPLERLISPFARTVEVNTPVAQASGELARLGIGLEAPPLNFRVGEERIYYTPEERQQLGETRQKALERISRLMDSSSYDRLPDQEDPLNPNKPTKRDAIMQIVNQIQGPITQRLKAQAMRRFKETSST